MTSGGRSPSDWVVSIQNKQLMIDPHCETGSQDVVVISAASESLITLHEVTALRFLLRQPSPNWKNFNINGITVINLLMQIKNQPSKLKMQHHLFQNMFCFRCIEAIYLGQQTKVDPEYHQQYFINTQ